VSLPPDADWFDHIEYYAFWCFLLFSFLYALYRMLKHKLEE
jgi:hypothetical protein